MFAVCYRCCLYWELWNFYFHKLSQQHERSDISTYGTVWDWMGIVGHKHMYCVLREALKHSIILKWYACMLCYIVQVSNEELWPEVQDKLGITRACGNIDYGLRQTYIRWVVIILLSDIWQAVSVLTYAFANSKTRSPAVARIADCTGCQWPSRSFEVHDSYFIWKGVNMACHFLLGINSNSGLILHRLATVTCIGFQGRPTSMIFMWFESQHAFFLLVLNSNLCLSPFIMIWPVFRFSLKNAHFLPPSIQLQFENVPLSLDCWNCACSSLRHIANYSCKKFFSMSYPLARDIHYRQTDDKHANSSTVT